MVVKKSGVCKVPNCNKAQVRDGYCQQCGTYHLQKNLHETMQLSTQLLLQVAQGLTDVQTNMQKLVNSNTPNVERVIEKTIIERAPERASRRSTDPPNSIKSKSVKHEEKAFIPTLDSDINVTIKDTNQTVLKKDISAVVAKLQQTSGGN